MNPIIRKVLLILLAIAFVIVVLCSYSCSRYNVLATANQSVKRAWSDVETTYQMRADKVPNLVSIVKGSAAHESNTLEAVTEARAKVGSISINADDLDEATLKKYNDAQSELTSAMKSFLAVSEAYPDLKANESFNKLLDEYNGIENRITTARRDYNKEAEEYNTTIVTFPNNFFAGIFGFKEKPYFSASAGAENAPQISF